MNMTLTWISTLITFNIFDLYIYHLDPFTPFSAEMYFTQTLLLSFISATSLALPTMETRNDNAGWVGSFTGDNCNGTRMAGAAENLSDPNICVKWSLATGSAMLAVQFSSGSQKTDSVIFYTDENCQKSTPKSAPNDYWHEMKGTNLKYKEGDQEIRETRKTVGGAEDSLCFSVIPDFLKYKSLKMFYDPDAKKIPPPN